MKHTLICGNPRGNHRGNNNSNATAFRLSRSGLSAASLLILGVLLSAACSQSENSASDTTQAPAAATAPTATENAGTNPTPPASAQTSPALPMQGKVVKAMHAGGYTYMQVENNGKQFWIAATMLNVKRNDQVHWADAAIMKDFKSSTLRRTFDEILFVSNAAIDK